LDVTLNVIFCAWLLYFLATGYLIPAPFLRDAPEREVIDLQQDHEPSVLPMDLPEES
jgi:hypothetical protein